MWLFTKLTINNRDFLNGWCMPMVLVIVFMMCHVTNSVTGCNLLSDPGINEVSLLGLWGITNTLRPCEII